VERELPHLPSGGYDELVDTDGRTRPISGPLWSHLARLGMGALDVGVEVTRTDGPG